MVKKMMLALLLGSMAHAATYPDAPYLRSTKSLLQTSFCKVNTCKALAQIKVNPVVTEEYYSVRIKGAPFDQTLVVTRLEGKVTRLAFRGFGQDYWPENDEVELVKFATGLNITAQQIQKASDNGDNGGQFKGARGRYVVTTSSLPFTDVADIWFNVGYLP